MFRRTVSVVALALAAACSGPPTTDTGKDNQATQPNAVTVSAAEPFEALTEQASTGSWQQVDGLISTVRAEAGAVRSKLPLASAARLDEQVAAILIARTAQDRLGVALASVEGYRTVVESQANANPPVAVSLLDYAGFRYDALSRAPNVNWTQMAETVAFARRQWNTLQPQVRSPALTGVVESALNGMTDATSRKDAAFAQSAAATELALVDLLEEHFAGR